MAPSLSLLPLSGMTRFRSKSIVLPNPWQRGHAPKGLLKENSRGSGSLSGRWQCLHSYSPEKRRRSRLPSSRAERSPRFPRNDLEDHFAGLAIRQSPQHPRCARGSPCETTIRSSRTKTGCVKSTSSSDSGVGKLKDLFILIEPIESRSAQTPSGAPSGHRSSVQARSWLPRTSLSRQRFRLAAGSSFGCSLTARSSEPGGRRVSHREQRMQPCSLAQRQHFLRNLVHRVALDQVRCRRCNASFQQRAYSSRR